MSSGDSKDAVEVDQNTSTFGRFSEWFYERLWAPRTSSETCLEELPDESAGFECVSHEDTIADCTFEQLIKKFRDNQYNVNVDAEELILVKCKVLFKKDYELKIVNNKGLTDNYPKELLIPIARKNAPEKEEPMNFDPELYSTLVHECRVARLRSRVIVPVILFDRKLICRSGTLTVMLSAIYEMAMKTMRSSEDEGASAESFSIVSTFSNVLWKIAEVAYNSVQLLTSADMMITLIRKDAKVLEHLNVERICDLMVEYNKHYKQQINLSSTEKIHEGIYKDIKIEGMPFPGCEFFVSYKQANRCPEGLVFDWNQSDVTRTLELTDDRRLFFPDLNPQDWRKWDLVELTRNYLKIMLSYLLTSTGSMNVHCISGWDRTPLFVSLLRLTLWADGLVHESLEPDEMAYFTVAYDWFLFGHNLPDRIRKGEEVMHFAFNFLQYITLDDFSLTKMFRDLPEEKKMGRNMPEFVPGRRAVLSQVRTCVLDAYDEHIIQRQEEEANVPELSA